MNRPVALPTTTAHMSDVELLGRVRGGDVDAYEGIMRHHNQRLFRIARSIVADDTEAMDVVQESFIRAYDKLPDLQTPEALPVWLSRIVRNAALMRLRKSQRIEYMDEQDVDNVTSLAAARRPDQPESRLANSQLRKMLEDCIDQLPPAFRTVFMLRAVQQCSVNETAAILDIKEATVKTRYHRARLLLQAQFMKYSDDAGIAVHEFAGHRCDTIVRNVLAALKNAPEKGVRFIF